MIALMISLKKKENNSNDSLDEIPEKKENNSNDSPEPNAVDNSENDSKVKENRQRPQSYSVNGSSFGVPDILLSPLVSMGFSKNRALRGLRATGSTSVSIALDHIMKYLSDPTQDDPITTKIPLVYHQQNNLRSESFKMVVVVRTDLNMGIGKIASQCCHATLGLYTKLTKENPIPKALETWNSQGSGKKKVVLKCNSFDEMCRLQEKAKNMDLPSYMVSDAGLTQVLRGSKTVLAIGPAQEFIIDQVTGHLKLL